MPHITFVEALDWTDADIRFTESGYMTATPRISRMGIQLYKGYEVGKPNMDTVRVYRPEDEVFHVDSMRSLAHRPVTIDHPRERVDSKNWKKYVVGYTADQVARDGQAIRVPLAVMDEDGINEWKQGKRQLSVGYSADLVWETGKTADGKDYDAVQRNIRGNHVAIVKAARGGPMLTVGDSFASFADSSSPPSNDRRRDDDNDPPRRRKRMENGRTITIDSIPIEVSDVGAGVVLRAIEQRDAKQKELQTTIDKLTADAKTAADAAAAAAVEAKKQFDTKAGEVTALTQKVKDLEITPAKLDEMARDRMGVISSALKVLGDKFDTSNKTDIELMRAVCDNKLGATATKAMNDDAVRGAFQALIPKGTETGRPGNFNQQRDAFSSAGGVHSSQDAAAIAYENNNKRLTNAWKQEQPKQ